MRPRLRRIPQVTRPLQPPERSRLILELPGVLRSQCLDRRIATRKRLVSEIAAWEHQRNHSGARINWMFSIDNARSKMARAYPETSRNMASPLKES